MTEFPRRITFSIAVVAALMLVGAGPAVAQQSRVYVCTDNTAKGNPVHRYRFGAGDFETFDTPIYTWCMVGQPVLIKRQQVPVRRSTL